MTAPSKYGVEDLKHLATACAHVASALDAIFSNGKVDAADLVRVPQVFQAIKEFYDIDWRQAVPEVSDLQPDEADALSQHFAQVFDLDEESIEATVEAGFELVMHAAEAFGFVRELAGRLKKTA